jgi:RHS repeat-associated protein
MIMSFVYKKDYTVQPKSGINFVLYSNTFDVVKENTGYLPVDDRINRIQTLASDRLIMKEAGFLDVFVNNEANTPVYYDNMTVTHNSGSSANVIEVNAYYPFGMIIPNLSLTATPDKYNAYKFGAKELQRELELNWYDFGARMYQPSIGRWWTPDPLAEKGYHLSPYAYAFNNPVNFIDPDGKWPGDLFRNQRLAAIDFGQIYNGMSIESGREYGSSIYPVKVDGKTYYTYSEPNIGTTYNVDISPPPILPPLGLKATAIVHTHGKYDRYSDNDNFSREADNDIDYFKYFGVDGYLATPSGILREYDVKTGKDNIISNEMPSDSRHPNRVNDINSSRIDLRRPEVKMLDDYLKIFKTDNP